MFKYYFEQVENVAIWPIISLAIFFVFFIGLSIYVYKMNRDHIKHMEKMPLAKDEENPISHSDLKYQAHG
ncbi:cytochrome C oxidase Cbb3 [Roseivirga sp.]|uniref:cytochrome C oxidase Cbb3 n=1 Tax=Roseivirga sp. TaxID=1964215 RepID=UPI003B8ABEAA